MPQTRATQWEISLRQHKHRSRDFTLSLPVTITVCVFSLAGCATQQVAPPIPPLKVVVAPITLEAAITKSTQIHSFDDDPSPEREPALFAQLEDEIQVGAQRFLTEQLARQEGFDVVPFQDTRRVSSDVGIGGKPWTEEQHRELGRQTNTDFVISGRILDYGRVRWQYSLAGLIVHASVELLIVGLLSAWNPIALGSWAAFDLTTDVPIWFGGGYIFGWAFRPVRIELSAIQLKACEGVVWTKQEFFVRVPGNSLDEYPPEEQKRKEVQLEANLNRALIELVETASQKLRQQPCREDGTPTTISSGTLWMLLDLLY